MAYGEKRNGGDLAVGLRDGPLPGRGSLVSAVILLLLVAMPVHGRGSVPRVIVLGVDGMDHGLTRAMLEEGKLPHLAALARGGSFLPLQTSMPPLSPVAWSNFITGTNPGGHGVYDFLRRDPGRVGDTLLPEDAVCRVVGRSSGDERRIPFTRYVWPPEAKMELLRKGAPLWQVLESHGIAATIYKVPANFPVGPGRSQVLSGMGTPDIEGTYGLFTHISTRGADWGKSLSGGRILKATVENGVVRVDRDGQSVRPFIHGPINPFISRSQPYESRRACVACEIHVDRARKSVAICLQDQDIVLNQSEWSAWVNVRFDLLPGVKSIKGIVRFYLQEASPELRLFVSPVNLAAGTEGLASGGLDLLLQEAVGPYFTKGMPEETKALMQGVFSTDEYLAQAELVFKEELAALDFLLGRQADGLLFFYISAIDLNSHVLWRHHDPNHPAYDKDQSPRYATRIKDLYIQIDGVIGTVRSQLRSGDILYVMSDHGFASVYRQFNLATWLADEGYLAFKRSSGGGSSRTLADVDWSKTRAYALGFQGLYINRKGREASGIVGARDYPALVDEIRAKLRAFQGGAVFRRVYLPAELYTGPCVADAPDLVLGYERGYGPSDEAVLGNCTGKTISQDNGGFSGSHAMDLSVVPGVLFCSHRLDASQAKLEDVTVTVLREFGVPADQRMTGTPLFKGNHVLGKQD